jgi:hypothetical protein
MVFQEISIKSGFKKIFDEFDDGSRNFDEFEVRFGE